jgi:DNA (cytosine-5)-methyltransferase 1
MNTRELIIDNFAGGGGASTGMELATGRPVDIAVNHDESAIAMHKANHPNTRHFCESVWSIDPREATNGKPVALAWFSPDCKHFSKAKGGRPVNKEIRGLAWVAVRWAATVHPRVIILENVEEFKTWGPVLDGKPVKEQAGRTFNSFVRALNRHGYKVDWRELRACDYGAPTIRKRFFLVARCDGQPIRWPEPTHGAPDTEAVKAGRLKPYRTAAEIIDWSLPCPSIFETSEEIWEKYGLRAIRPLADATLRRIARGLRKFVFETPEPFIVDFKYDNGPKSAKDPLRTVTGVNGYGLVAPCIMPNNENNVPVGATDPVPTVTTGNRNFLVTPTLIQYHGEQSRREVRGQAVESPLLTADAANRYGLVTAFLSKYFSGGYTGAGIHPGEPMPTVTAVDHNAVVTSHLTIFRNHCDGQPLAEPFNTVMTSAGHFGEVRAMLVKYYGKGDAQELREPLHTVTAQDRFGIVTIHGEEYAIVDIGLRMLTPRELFNAQGFPPDYIIDVGPQGETITKAAQVARCGNAVPPPFAEALVRANLPELCGPKIGSMEALRKEMAG